MIDARTEAGIHGLFQRSRALTDSDESAIEITRLVAELSLERRQSCLWDVNQAGDFLGISTDSVYEKANTKEIPSFRVGGSIRFHPEQLADLGRESRATPERKGLAISRPRRAVAHRG